MPDLPRVGEEFAGYRLRSRLGRGSMSVVYQAENWRLGNVVALKIIAPDLANDDTFRSRFLQEAQIAAQLNHPHVVPIIDAGTSDGLLYIAMRYVAGTDLGQLLAQRGRLAPDVAVRLLSQAALALDAAHRRGLVHRDVKPANLLLERTSDDADPDHLYLADFGISKQVAGLTGLTQAGAVLGTSLYLAPEQAQELAVDGAADQYALGCVLYECLTGRVPFDRNSAWALAQAHVVEAVPLATPVRPELPPAIDDVFARVLAKQPRARYPSCRDFMADAQAALLGADRTGRPGGAGYARRPAPAPPGPVPDEFPARSSGSPTQSAEVPVMEPLPGPGQQLSHGQRPAENPYQAQQPYLADQATGDIPWPPSPGAGGGRGWHPGADGGRGRPVRRGRGHRWRGSRILWSAVIFAAAAAATAGGLLLSRAGDDPALAPRAATSSATSSLLPGQLASVLGDTEQYTGMLKLSACHSVSLTDVQCGSVSPAIAKVTFATYPSLSALYSKYQEIVDNLIGHKSFADVQNEGRCSAVAPEPTDESAWNHSDVYSLEYTVNEMASGSVATDLAMGRVFCEQTGDGSAIFVWTQDSGRLLGYATGGDASHEDVWRWFYEIHHHIVFPGDPGMSGMTAAPSAGKSASG